MDSRCRLTCNFAQLPNNAGTNSVCIQSCLSQKAWGIAVVDEVVRETEAQQAFRQPRTFQCPRYLGTGTTNQGVFLNAD